MTSPDFRPSFILGLLTAHGVDRARPKDRADVSELQAIARLRARGIG